DNRIRNMFVYHGAHTGRWSGRGFQPHNLARGIKCDVEELLKDLNIDTIKAAGRPDQVLSTLLRSVFESDTYFGICDYSEIEARGVCWCGDAPFSENINCEMAETVYGRPIAKHDSERQIGKVIIL